VINLRSRTALAAVILGVPALAGCSTNFGAPTDQVYNPARGVNDRSGRVDVLNALVVSGTDGSGTVVATLVNNESGESDRLVSVAVDGATANINAGAGSTDIGPLGYLNLGTTGAVSASSDRIVPGNFVDIAFTFQRGKAITVHAPVVPHSGDYEDVPVKQAR